MSGLRFLGEFSDPELEKGFQADDWRPTSKRMRFICLITSILYVAAAFADYEDLGPGLPFQQLLSARIVVGVLGLVCYLFLLRRRAPGQQINVMLCAYMVVLMLCESLELGLKTQLPGPMSIPGTVFIVLAYYLFLPPRIFVAILAGLGGSAVYLATMLLATPASMGSLTTTTLFLLLANLFGIYFVRGFGRSRRREFLSMRRLKELVDFDDLTGVFNRRCILKTGESLFLSARRYATHLSVLMIDVDRFKGINDVHGHAAGDMVLARLARRCASMLREVDFFGRLGGEEFVALLPYSDMAQALIAAERIRYAVEQENFDDERVSIRVTLSIGCQMLDPKDRNFSDLLRRADHELYLAKQRGRNLVSPECSDQQPLWRISSG
ncbi:MAG: diguanylate cyclase [Desulfovibrio sp.]